jgi:hypothetical protein
VRVGAQPGVYQNWNDCLAQITGFPKAKFKSFPTREDAQDFVDGGNGDVHTVNKWVAVRVGHVPGVYATVREAMEQTKDYPDARYRFFTSQVEARDYVDAEPSPASQRTKRILPQVPNLHNDQSQLSVKKQRSDANIETLAYARYSEEPIRQTPDGTESDIAAPNHSVGNEDIGDILDAELDEASPPPQASRPGSQRSSTRQDPGDPVDNLNIDALRSENARLRAEIQELTRPAARVGLDTNQYHAADTYTVLLAFPYFNHTPTDQRSLYPEASVSVLGVYDSNADATLAAWQAYHQNCPKVAGMKMKDLGVTPEFIDKTKTTKSTCQQRRTPLGELRLYWRDAHGSVGLLMVQKNSGHRIKPDTPRPESRQEHNRAAIETPQTCYLVCEHFASNDKLRQDGGMLAAFKTKARANEAAEQMFHTHFMKDSTDTISETSVEAIGEGDGVWKYMQRGRRNFLKRNEHGETKVWVHKFELR